ncbi:MAG: hypothetical protein LVO36_04485 [Nitrosopumilus sp. (ex Thoosa mismalolli)]|nr:hypothetical protein [Nitrosopumilus sp. (ex Thoosa mismalolli)]
MSSKTTNEQFRANMLAEIKNILTDLSQIKEMAAGQQRENQLERLLQRKR